MTEIHNSEEEIKALLKDPQLLNILLKETQKKIKGEKDTSLFLVLSACNIFVENSKEKLHVLGHSKSSTGKSYVFKKILKIFPQQKVVTRNRISERALTYLKPPEGTWDGKILYLEDVEENVLNSDVLKVFMSEGGGTSTIVINNVAVNIEIKGKPLIFTTTAESEPKTEIANRMNQISMDETPVQTHSVNMHTARLYQEGEVEEYDHTITTALGNLERVKVRIPYCEAIVNSFPISNVKSRRDFKRFCELILSSAALHQCQREKDRDGYFLANGQDYEYARQAFEKLQFSEGLVNLTPTEKEMLEVCENLTRKSIKTNEETGQEEAEGFTSQEAIAKYPNASGRYWYILLKKLAGKDHGLLEIKLRKVEGAKKPVRYFTLVKEYSPMSLPNFEVIKESQ